MSGLEAAAAGGEVSGERDGCAVPERIEKGLRIAGIGARRIGC